MKTLRMMLLAALLALGAGSPMVVALTTMTPQPSHPAILRIADEPTPTPTPTGPQGPGGCGSGSC